jgi:hypothetical protein
MLPSSPLPNWKLFLKGTTSQRKAHDLKTQSRLLLFNKGHQLLPVVHLHVHRVFPAKSSGITGDWTGSGITKVGTFSDGFWWTLDLDGNGVYESGTDIAFATAARQEMCLSQGTGTATAEVSPAFSGRAISGCWT